ncbi:MAG TPA: LytTR family DNA-binding domain-containing protein [Thermoanaerobaculia bacterium]|nr:LytTR family DNA-binding domain-containing protein [Thermoanaerobaculia bacterium]
MRDAIRLLIADDEEPARMLLRDYAAEHPDFALVAECKSVDELSGELVRSKVDVAILDIKMPGHDIFEILGAIDPRSLPLVVFATAHDRYAIRAFEMNAVDYLLKPYSAERFATALDRARGRLAKPASQEGLTRALRDLGPRPERLLVPHRGKLVPVAVADIIWIQSEGDYARIHTADRSYLVARTMTELEARLDATQFLRIHRTAIIRTDRIREVVAEGSSRYRVILDGAPALIVSRTRAALLKKWML